MTAIELTRPVQSGRKPARTDYVYVVSLNELAGYAAPIGTTRWPIGTTRKLTSAKRMASNDAGKAIAFRIKFGRNEWLGSGYVIQRMPLHN